MTHEKQPSASPDPGRADEVARKVRQRRARRRLKAAASLVLAAVAGTFVACFGRQKDGPRPAPNPTTPEVSNLPAAAEPESGRSQGHGGTAGAAGTGGGGGRGGTEAKGVDRTEHRKGMPVPDNLLE